VTNRPEPNDTLQRVGRAAWALVGVLVLAGLVGVVAWWARILIIPVVGAMVIVYVLDPLVRVQSRLGIHRAIGTTMAYLVASLVMVLIGFWTFPVISEQAAKLAARLPVIYDDLTGVIEGLLALLGIDAALLRFDDLIGLVNDLSADLQASIQNVAGQVFSVALGIVEVVVLVFIAPVVAFYVLVDLPNLGKSTVDLLPERVRPEALHVGERLGRALGGFVRGQLLAATFVGVLSAVGYGIIGLDLWLIVAIIAGLFNMIPFVGPWVAGILAVGVALVSGDLRTAIAAAVVALVVQQLDNNFVSPLVLRATVKLHPALIILALLVGGSVGGVLGVVLAVPLLAVTKVLVGHIWRTRVLGEPWQVAVEAIVHQQDPSVTAEMLAVRRRRRDRDDEGDTDA
jgi:predicted PurR-regulated permease PerM